MQYPQFNTLENLTLQDPTSHWFDNVSSGTVVVQNATAVINQAFHDAVSHLTTLLGPTPASWVWGDLHFREFPALSGLSALSRGPYSAGGDDYTLNVAAGLTAEGGPSWRQVIDLKNPDNSLAIYPGGQSGNPLSVHYVDCLVGSYLSGRYLRFRDFPNQDSILATSVESIIMLSPG